MKKIYFLASGLMLTTAALAQTFVPTQRAITSSFINEVRPETAQDRAPGDVIGSYSDDFSTPANWAFANTSSPAMNWAINTTGPSSAPELINSTSGGNFAWYDCDPQGNGSTVDATLTHVGTFNLTANPYVMVSFEQFYMDYYEDVFVEVSTNGTAGPWTSYEVNADYLPNAFSPVNPVLTLVNISTQAGGQANVGVRFHYTGGWGWSWQIDDFALVEAYQNDLTISATRFTSGTEGNEYYMIPTSQITEFTFGALIKSNGVVTQTNTYMSVLVNGGTEYNDVSGQLVSLGENVTDTFSIETNGWTPSGVGAYDLEMIAVTDDYTDQLIADNTFAAEPITVGGNVYARDNGVMMGSFNGFTTTVGEPLEIGNTFEFFATQSFGKVQIQLVEDGSPTNEGQLIYAAVYWWNAGTSTFDLMTNSPDYTIAAGEEGAMVELNLNANVDAVAGDIFLVCAGYYDGNTPVLFAEAQGTATNSVLAMSLSGLIGGSDPSAVMVRAVFEPTELSVNDVAPASKFIAYPNPANDVVNVTYNLNTSGNVMLTVTDLSGKVVMTNDFGTQAEGNYSSTLNTSELSNGVYFYTLNVDGVSVTRKLTIANN